ncbi:hypothetical protein [Actinomadura sp. CNU-125]|uniref:hypothetical protein n=1 Tax=Actinomadura sp. CNU-125 TaxID=1904961 RepID=UPI001177E64B|nr:hypothetical protein [Actinomadura sp. CNU-125]
MTPLDLNGRDFITEPYPAYAWLRDVAPVHHLPAPDLWLVSRHDDVVAVLRDTERFSSDLGDSASFDNNPFNPAMKASGPLTRLLKSLRRDGRCCPATRRSTRGYAARWQKHSPRAGSPLWNRVSGRSPNGLWTTSAVTSYAIWPHRCRPSSSPR